MTASKGSHADKRRRILALLADAKWAMRSTKWLARFTGCDEATVRRLRRLSGDASDGTRLYRRMGKVLEMRIGNLTRPGDAP